jgi:predicted membrane-bound spermidine synthase
MTASDLLSYPPVAEKSEKPKHFWPYYLLFFSSGFPALLYQIVWQRALFTIYGVNIQSVTVIVTVFMLGLGFGSLAGGRLSIISSIQTLRAFGFIELSIGVFGACSLALFKYVAQFTAGASTATTGIVTFLLLLIPTLLMGSTLPLLVAFMVRRSANVGESVGALYAVNTFGSGVACLFASLFLMRLLGESGSVSLAASMNFVVGTCAVFLARRADDPPKSQAQPPEPHLHVSHPTIGIAAGMTLAAATGFVALAYEILWYHIYSFTSGGTASCFANLLAFYLFGIAYGSFAVRDASRQKLRNDLHLTLRVTSLIVALGTIASFLVGPAVAFSISAGHIPYIWTFPFIAIAAALLGAAFPLLAHAAIGPTEQAGKKLSYLYLSNIIGSALGSFIIGFIVLDHWSTRQTSLFLLVLGFSLVMILAYLARPLRSRFLLGCTFAVCVVLAVSSHTLFTTMFERLLLKGSYQPGTKFKNLVENRSGIIAVDRNETVYGGGIYDGQFNVAPFPGTNAIFRAYAIAALHPHPRQVPVIGLASGSWAQVLANHPDVQDMTIVEINPGYGQLIQQRPMVSSLLRNPKVHVVIDDGRRWLISHPDRKFDFILMNTTYNWRANTSNLLSVDFLKILRQHMNPSGVAYYNTTSSGDVQFTGATVFPYALRVSNFLAVSDSPINFDRERCKKILMGYRIDEQPVFDLSKADDRNALEQIISLPLANSENRERGLDFSIENRSSLLSRLKGSELITDDNMGTEWKNIAL